MTNLRVDRIFRVWLAEKSTYFSYLPLDIIGLIQPYLPLETWATTYRWERVSWYLAKPGVLQMKHFLLADGSIILFINHVGYFYLESTSQDFGQFRLLLNNLRYVFIEHSRS